MKAIDAVATIRPSYYVHRISPAGPGYYNVVVHDAPDLNDVLRKFYICPSKYNVPFVTNARAQFNVISNPLLTLNVIIDKMAAKKCGFWKRCKRFKITRDSELWQ